METLLDARRLKLVYRYPVMGKQRARSIFWHRVDSLPCSCRWPHGNCHDSPCTCARHKYDLRSTDESA